MTHFVMERTLFPQLIAERAAHQPEEVFLQAVDGTVTTFGALHRQALSWARALRDLGVGAGDPVMTLFPLGPEAAAAWLALAWVGAIEVPVNPALPPRMLDYMRVDSGAELVITGDAMLPGLKAAFDGVEPIRVVSVTELDVGDGDESGPGPTEEQIACVIYTSGTTGPAKGVLVPWRQMWGFAAFMARDLPPDARPVPYLFLPPFHVSGRAPLWFAAAMGGHVVHREMFSLTSFWSDVRAGGCNFIPLMGTMASMLLAAPETPGDVDNPARWVFMAPVIPAHREFERRFGVVIRTGYASSEVGPCFSTGYGFDDPTICGHLEPGYSVRLVDEEGRDVPTGSVGELLVRHVEPHAMNAGYLNRPQQSAEAWAGGWFHTGDAFRVDEHGNYRFVDRLRDCLRRRGENISSFEVEAVINGHPEVAESAVIGVPADHGEDDVACFVVRHPESQLDAPGLVAFLASRLAKHMLPRFVTFVDVLPKTDGSLRVRKVALRQLAAATLPDWDRQRPEP